MPSRRRPLLCLLVLPLGAILLACGTDDTTTSADPGPTASSPVTTSVPVSEGCPATYPQGMSVDAPYSDWVTACEDGRGGLWIKNGTEAAALHVFVSTGSAYLNVGPAPQTNPAEQAMAVAVVSMRYPDNSVLLPPGVVLTTSDATRNGYSIDMEIEPRATERAMVTAATAAFVEDHIGSRAQRLTKSVADCGKSVVGAATADPDQTAHFLLQQAYAGQTCASLLAELREADAPPPSASSLADDALRVADEAPRTNAETLRKILGAVGKAAQRLVQH